MARFADHQPITHTTNQQAAQQVDLLVIVALGKTLVVHALFLGSLPDFLGEDGRGVHGDPFCAGT